MPDEERELTPEQEAELRRLLREARATEPLPNQVAARLDRVLVGLDEERGGQVARHVVAPASRRRRATVVLVAAAAVVAIGVGLGQIDGLQGGADSDGADVSSQDAGAAPERATADGELTEDTSKPSEESGGVSGPIMGSEAPEATTPVGRIRAERFTADANQLRRALPAQSADGEFVRLSGGQLPQGYVLTGQLFECAPARWGAGVLVPVFFDKTPAVLAYRPVLGESQIVELLQCGTGDTLRSTTLQAG